MNRRDLLKIAVVAPLAILPSLSERYIPLSLYSGVIGSRTHPKNGLYAFVNPVRQTRQHSKRNDDYHLYYTLFKLLNGIHYIPLIKNNKRSSLYGNNCYVFTYKNYTGYLDV